MADPAKRITAKEIQTHAWITNTTKPKKEINVLEAMRNWDTKRKLEVLNKKGEKEQQPDGNSSDTA